MKTTLRRWLRELRRLHVASDVTAALASLSVSVDGDTALVTRSEEGGASLLRTRAVTKTVTVGPDVYVATPTTEARVQLLSVAASIGRTVRVHAPNTTDGTHRGRIGIDLPRRMMRALRLSTAEPGDRFEGRFVHVFFDDEPLVAEAERAGLRFTHREGGWIHFEHGGPPNEAADGFASELVRTLRSVRAVERLRRESPPEGAVAATRALGRRAKTRGVVGRARLRRAIGWIDAGFPGGPNCFRRVLAEIALDAGAASETLLFGLDVGSSGHVSFKGAEERAFDVVFEIR